MLYYLFPINLEFHNKTTKMLKKYELVAGFLSRKEKENPIFEKLSKKPLRK